jgi:hypothetical protein
MSRESRDLSSVLPTLVQQGEQRFAPRLDWLGLAGFARA